jgi:GNAT superfamily N-acetyltransferase
MDKNPRVFEADLSNPLHAQGVLDVLDSYASDVVGGGQPLSREVRDRLPSILRDLAVLPEHRGHGVGRALLQAAEDHARRKGCCKLTLEVQDDNTRARILYRRFGFEDFVVGKSAPTRFLAKKLEA